MNGYRTFALRSAYDSRNKRCAPCNGSGRITKKDGRYRARLKCEACGGTGRSPS